MSSLQRILSMRPGRRCRMLTPLLGLALVGVTPAAGQDVPAVSLPDTREHVVQSSINGKAYQVRVALPPGYGADTSRYPTLYLLDGNVSLPLLASMLRYGNLQQVEPVLLVGVGYVNPGLPRPMANRTEDLTPTADPTGDWRPSGGGPAFARVLREEIIPLIERTYRTNGDRGLQGNSFGGLFATYMLLEQPDLFERYIINTPSVWWDREVLLTRESRLASARPPLPKRVYLGVGEYDADYPVDATHRLADSLRSHAYAGLELTTDYVRGEPHSGVTTALHGLRALYPRVTCELTRAADGAYAGNCRDGPQRGTTLTLRPPAPSSPTLWRGNGKLSWRREPEPLSVDLRQGGSFRTGTEWYVVTRAVADSAKLTFSFNWDMAATPTAVDLAILRRARTYLTDSSRWDPSAPADTAVDPARGFSCPAAAGRRSRRTFFCALYDASIAEAGEYWHGRPAMRNVREVIELRGAGLRHPLLQVNSHPQTTLPLLQAILNDASRRVARRLELVTSGR